MVSFKFETTGNEWPIIATLTANLSATDLTAFADSYIVEYLREKTSDNFEEEQAPDGSKWADLKEKTQKRRASLARNQGLDIEPDTPINVRFASIGDGMRSWILGAKASYAPFAGGTTVTWPAGSDKASATKKQSGGSSVVEKIEYAQGTRPVLGIHEDDGTHITAALTTAYNSLMAAAAKKVVKGKAKKVAVPRMSAFETRLGTVRHVRTEAGAARYGVPIGQPIPRVK